MFQTAESVRTVSDSLTLRGVMHERVPESGGAIRRVSRTGRACWQGASPRASERLLKWRQPSDLKKIICGVVLCLVKRHPVSALYASRGVSIMHMATSETDEVSVKRGY